MGNKSLGILWKLKWKIKEVMLAQKNIVKTGYMVNLGDYKSYKLVWSTKSPQLNEVQ